MKASIWKDLIVVAVIITLAYFFLFHTVKDIIKRHDIESSNLNMNFIGKNKGDYVFSRAISMNDGSILIASSLMNKPGTISLIKLNPNLQINWEKVISDPAKETRREKNKSFLKIEDIKVSGENIRIFAIDETYPRFAPVFITTDLNGNLLHYILIPHAVNSNTAARGILLGDSAYFTWFDHNNKLLSIYKLLWNDPKFLEKHIAYLINDHPRFTGICSDTVHQYINMTTYDSRKGSSLFAYSDSVGLNITNETNPDQELQLVRFIDSKLHVVDTKDSSVVVGVVHSRKEADKILDFKISTNDFAPHVLAKNGDYYYIGIDQKVPSKKSVNGDIFIYKYSENNRKLGEFHIGGKSDDELSQLIFTPDGYILAIGNSDSHHYGVGWRLFATKFKL
ncbi:MAG TPA: hypothetical protein PLE74_08630 [Candidatus Cloacimonadota bacterium]|nr:hypothetical protein [Candidatus Cloacimonadota bacterium]HPT72332.1 hypothetical protein [Candidatus Cloacimonadota bacterium]